MALYSDIEIHQRNDEQYVIPLEFDDGSIINPDDFTIKYSVKDNLRKVVINKESGAGITTIDNLSGIIEIDITQTDTDIEPMIYKHELVLIEDSTGDRKTVMEGTFEIIESQVD